MENTRGENLSYQFSCHVYSATLILVYIILVYIPLRSPLSSSREEFFSEFAFRR